MTRRLFVWALLAAIFAAVGRSIDKPRFWVFAGIWLGIALYGLLAVDPSLADERRKPAGATIDPGALMAIRLSAATAIVLALIDIDRFHWSDTVPSMLRIPAMALYAAGALLAVHAMIANRFFSVAVRIQNDRGHHVISGGPYRFVRHPGWDLRVFVLDGEVLTSMRPFPPT